jgi:hypothetical protein
MQMKTASSGAEGCQIGTDHLQRLTTATTHRTTKKDAYTHSIKFIKAKTNVIALIAEKILPQTKTNEAPNL